MLVELGCRARGVKLILPPRLRVPREGYDNAHVLPWRVHGGCWRDHMQLKMKAILATGLLAFCYQLSGYVQLSGLGAVSNWWSFVLVLALPPAAAGGRWASR